MEIKRRAFIKAGAGSAALTLAFQVGGGIAMLTPEQARAKGVRIKQFSSGEAQALEKLAEGMVPGATRAGIAHFIDHQVGVDPDDCLLIAKYFPVPQPYRTFYRHGLAAAATLSERKLNRKLLALDAAGLHDLIGELGRPGTKVDDFDTSLFYVCLRSDAVDVVYGTPKGFEKLDVPYMAHIMPPEGWNG